MGDIRKVQAVVKKITDETSSSGNDYKRVHLHDDTTVDFYSDSWKEELEENHDEYVGLVVEVFYEDRGYTFGQVIVPASNEKAGELLEKKISDDFEGLTEEEKEDVMEKVEKIYQRDKGDQSGLDQYAA